MRASHRLSPPDTLKVQAVEQRVYLRVVRPATERFVLTRPIHTLVFILWNSRHRRRGAYPPDPSRRTDEPGHERISARRATYASRVQSLHRPLKFTQFRILVNILMRTLRRPGLHPASVDSTRRSHARPPPAQERSALLRSGRSSFQRSEHSCTLYRAFPNLAEVRILVGPHGSAGWQNYGSRSHCLEVLAGAFWWVGATPEKSAFTHSTGFRVKRWRGKLVLPTLTGANEGTDMGKTPEKKSSGKKAPFGTTKGAFGKEGKGGKGRGGRPLGKMVSTAAPPLFSGGT